MYAGQVVERAGVDALYEHPRHPYTEALLSAMPQLTARSGRLATIPGSTPPAGAMPPGCRFHPRCGHVVDACRDTAVAEHPLAEGGTSRCLRVSDLALKGSA
jgi:peptide/nickel transport system ATP-binding protein